MPDTSDRMRHRPGSALPQLLFRSADLVLVSLTPFGWRYRIDRQPQVTGVLKDELIMIDGHAVGIDRALGCEHGGLVDPEDRQQFGG